MKTNNENMRVSVLTLAVQGALIVMFTLPLVAHAEDAVDDETIALTHPTNSVEVGATYVSKDSAKFGEYNGLDESGLYGIANLNLRGGNAYDGGATRWEVKGLDLGTTSRSLGGSVSNQGQWNIGINYDELRHNISDTYQTPLQGKIDGSNFTLPASFGTINANNATPSARVLNADQLSAFHKKNIHTDRKNTSFDAGYTISPQFNVQFDYNHLNQDGAKLIGTGSQGGISLLGGSTGRAEGNNIIMNPTNYTTDTFNLALNWIGDKGHLTTGYYGSIFRNENSSLSWQNALATGASGCVGASCYVNNTMSTAPDNSFHQINLTGGYSFTPSTKLAGGLSYGRNTQDDSFASTSIMQASGTAFNMMQVGGLPRSSLNAKVITTHADLKLTNQTTKDLVLSGAFKYNERDNKTDSNTYQYIHLGNAAYTGVNTPHSNRKTQYELAADYRVAKGHNIRLAYERENIKRWCDGVVGGSQCVASPSSDEDKIGVTYRLKAREDVNLNASYSYAKRRADFDHSFFANIGDPSNVAARNTVNAAATLNAGDKLGFAAYPYADRRQNLVKAGVNWQATEKLDMSLSSRYAKDNYDAVLGVQDGHSIGINLDATYSYNENSNISAYASWQNGQRDLRNGNDGSATVAPINIWTNRLEDTSNVVGLNAKHNGLMKGKLEILGDLSYSLDRSEYSTKVPYLATCSAANVLSCGSAPDIRSEVITLKLTGNYQVNKHGKITIGYIFEHRNTNDYFFNGLQFGSTPNRVIPTGEQAPNYSVNVVTASYIYTF